VSALEFQRQAAIKVLPDCVASVWAIVCLYKLCKLC